jgi:ESCRT-II complex subunit VPS36
MRIPPHPQILKTLSRLAAEHSDGIDAVDAARLAGLAPAIAREHLLAAEAQGALCRDDAPDGLRFFPNRFRAASASVA